MFPWFDILAVGLLGLTGAIRAAEHKYDWIGVLTLAFVTGCGGGLLRDILLNVPPVMLQQEVYIFAVLISVALGFLFYKLIRRVWFLFELVDTIGLALYAAVGCAKALQIGLSLQAATLVGTLNAIGGGIIRDILVRKEPEIFKPGQWYASLAILAALSFGYLVSRNLLPTQEAVIFVVLITVILRALVVRLNLRTRPIRPWGYIDSSLEK